jgi:aminoglycoside 3-N-acetyltransferase
MHARSQLADDFRKLGAGEGDTVMLHASVRAVGRVIGGPDQIHLALQDAVTDSGTVLMYASCPRYYDEVGRGNLTPDEETQVLEHLPPFDPLTARAAQDNGVLAEFFRTWPGTVVNHHVARFAVRGARAEFLVAPQPWEFPFGHGSLLERFIELDGVIALVGSDHDNVTFLHYVEHVADIPGKRITTFKVPMTSANGTIWRESREVDTNVAHDRWPDRFFSTIVDAFLRETGNRGAMVGDARSYVIRARDLAAFARPVMERVARGERTEGSGDTGLQTRSNEDNGH